MQQEGDGSQSQGASASAGAASGGRSNGGAAARPLEDTAWGSGGETGPEVNAGGAGVGVAGVSMFSHSSGASVGGGSSVGGGLFAGGGGGAQSSGITGGQYSQAGRMQPADDGLDALRAGEEEEEDERDVATVLPPHVRPHHPGGIAGARHLLRWALRG